MDGVGVMIGRCWGEPADLSKYYGRTIQSIKMNEERLTLAFTDSTAIEIWDDGQSCCEHRHMTTDDNIETLVGGKLARIEVKDGPTETGEWGDEHETCFVEVGTDQGFITLVNHNEHNGYYGGFGLTITEK